MDFQHSTIHELADLLAQGKTSAVQMLDDFLARIEEKDSKIGAFIRIDRDAARKAAEESDKRRAEGKALSPYDGILIGIKDCISVKNDYIASASQILSNVISPYDSTVVERLKAKGFIPFGRLNMDEFAMGSSCENSSFLKTHNPFDTDCVPGGSSGGSAAAVAAGITTAALGSDTGGSIRQPASFCGIVGLKPTYGRISRNGLVAFASSLDQIGPMTKSVYDAALLYDMIAGQDPLDSTSLPYDGESCAAYLAEQENKFSLEGVRIGLPKEYSALEGVTPGVQKVMAQSMETLKSLGATFTEISLPHTKYAMACYYIIATAEASANLERFDGVRYGYRSPESDSLTSMYMKSRGEGFGPEVQRRIMLGTYVLSSGYYDAYYLRAQKVRTLLRRDFENAYKDCDLIFTPVSPIPAFRFNEKSDPLQMYLSDIFTTALNLSGDCGISIPAGLDEETGMPVGIQLMAGAFREKSLLYAAAAFESARQQKVFRAPL